MSSIKQLRPTEVEYRGHTITLTHRPRINDWQFHFTHTRSINITDKHTRYDAALQMAKSLIDAFED